MEDFYFRTYSCVLYTPAFLDYKHMNIIGLTSLNSKRMGPSGLSGHNISIFKNSTNGGSPVNLLSSAKSPSSALLYLCKASSSVSYYHETIFIPYLLQYFLRCELRLPLHPTCLEFFPKLWHLIGVQIFNHAALLSCPDGLRRRSERA